MPKNLINPANDGFAFVKFFHSDDARDFFSVYSVNGLPIKNIRVRVTWAHGARQPPEVMAARIIPN